MQRLNKTRLTSIEHSFRYLSSQIGVLCAAVAHSLCLCEYSVWSQEHFTVDMGSTIILFNSFLLVPVMYCG